MNVICVSIPFCRPVRHSFNLAFCTHRNELRAAPKLRQDRLPPPLSEFRRFENSRNVEMRASPALKTGVFFVAEFSAATFPSRCGTSSSSKPVIRNSERILRSDIHCRSTVSADGASTFREFPKRRNEALRKFGRCVNDGRKRFQQIPGVTLVLQPIANLLSVCVVPDKIGGAKLSEMTAHSLD